MSRRIGSASLIAAVSVREWVEDARCRGEDPELFFQTETRAQAVRICNRCPVKTQCLETAVASREQLGVWGGLTTAQRHAWARKQRD